MQSLQGQLDQQQTTFQMELTSAQDKSGALQAALAEQKQLTKQGRTTDTPKGKPRKAGKEAQKESSESESNDDSELTAEEKIQNQSEQIKKLQ